MSKIKLYDTTFIRSTTLPDQTANLFDFIVKNRYIYLDKDIQNMIYKNRSTISSSGVNLLFSHIIDSGLIEHFAPIDVSTISSSIPHVLTNSAITIDTAQFQENKIIRHYPEFYNKCIINLAPLIKRDKYSPNVFVSDVNELHKLFVRGFLTMSYNDSNGWLTPQICKYMMHSFSMTLGGYIANIYKLDSISMINTAFFLSLYMCQRLMNDSDDPGKPLLMMLCTYLGSRNEISYYLDSYYERTKHGLSFQDTCDLIAETGPDRLKRLTVVELNRLTSKICQDIQTGIISYEYPPYWMYQILIALSKTNIGLTYNLKNHKLIDEGKKMIMSLITNKDIAQSIKR